jgi:hypothetical protein
MRETYQIGPRQIVTVTIEASDAPDTGERPYTAQERRVAELERLLALSAAREDALEARVQELLGELAGAENRARAYDQDRHAERDRANQNRAWAERAEAAVARMAEEKREALRPLAEKLGRVAGAVHTPEIADALARLDPSESDHVLHLAHAVRVVRDIAGSPTPPVTSRAV